MNVPGKPEIVEPTEDVYGRVEPDASEIPQARWQELEARWNKILGLEASMDTMRISLEAQRTEMEASLRKTLTGDDRIYASTADVAQWTKAKSRVHFAMPKVREFIHRATWAHLRGSSSWSCSRTTFHHGYPFRR